jgi:transcriptional regulator with XRE-family HTH domain
MTVYEIQPILSDKLCTIRRALARIKINAHEAIGVSRHSWGQWELGHSVPPTLYFSRLVELTNGFVTEQERIEAYSAKAIAPEDRDAETLVETHGNKLRVTHGAYVIPLGEKMKTLQQRAKEEGTTLAIKWGVSVSGISHYLLGRRCPKPETLQAIIDNSWGLVTTDDFVLPGHAVAAIQPGHKELQGRKKKKGEMPTLPPPVVPTPAMAPTPGKSETFTDLFDML